ncbi:winged helix-turn-helix transcriptional regulator [Methanooceanicella nereidis]|nr:winged helix-turn-helix transcriptional regulator [Methanocella sp. CWC-04]
MKKPMVFEGIVVALIIVLMFVMLVVVMTSDRVSVEKWGTAGDMPISFMSLAEDGLYAFSDKSVSFLDRNGEVKWIYTVPEGWSLITERNVIYRNRYDCELEKPVPVFDTDNGTLYLYAIKGEKTLVGENITHPLLPYFTSVGEEPERLNKKLIALDVDGNLIWEHGIEEFRDPFDIERIFVKNGRVYFHHLYNETVFDRNGSVIFHIEGVSDPVAVDENDNIFLIKGETRYIYSDGTWQNMSIGEISQPTAKDYALYLEYKVPSDVIESYGPDGRLLWAKDIKEYVEKQYQPIGHIQRQYVSGNIRNRYGSMPVYDHGNVYVFTDHGIYALNTNGTLEWKKSFYPQYIFLLDAMPFDMDGNIYFKKSYDKINTYYPAIEMISSDGKEISSSRLYVSDLITMPGEDVAFNNDSLGGKDGIIYLANYDFTDSDGSEDLVTVKITAYDLKNDSVSWAFKMPVYGKKIATFDFTTGHDLFSNDISSGHFWEKCFPENVTKFWAVTANAIPGDDVVYIHMNSLSGEWPLVPGKSEIAYSTGMAAVGMDGRMIWYRSIGSPLGYAVVNNSTIYYNMQNEGKIFASSINLAAGVTIAALFYVFIRFFFIGAVSRARDRLGKNENRNLILDYIIKNPGSTLSDMSSGLNMNLGTVRYHLMILSINHRIVTHRADSKYVRYFKNSDSYTDEEQMIASLLKRYKMKKILELIIKHPGISNAEISRAMDISESAVSKSMKVLYTKELVAKMPLEGNATSYILNEKYKEKISSMIESSNSE